MASIQGKNFLNSSLIKIARAIHVKKPAIQKVDSYILSPQFSKVLIGL